MFMLIHVDGAGKGCGFGTIDLIGTVRIDGRVRLAGTI